MRKRPYYSIRTGKNPNAVIDLPMLLALFRDTYKTFSSDDYFQQAFGYDCVDNGEVSGELGSDIEAQMFRKLRKRNLWPIHDKCTSYSEDDLFDVIEFLYDCVSKPIHVDSEYHGFDNCGWHCSEFDKTTGQQKYQEEISVLLRDYKDGYELSEDGEILELADIGLDHLFEANLPSSNNPKDVNDRVNVAIRKFRRYRSSVEDRRDAVRDLADVLEFLRPSIKLVLVRQDESDLFHIANKFGIRHHKEGQKNDYNKSIWYSWMFYYYLATIHAVLGLIEEQENNA